MSYQIKPVAKNLFIRRINPTAGPGMNVPAVSARLFLNGTDHLYVYFDTRVWRNSCLSPKSSNTAEDPENVFFDRSQLLGLLDKGATSFTFFLGFKNAGDNPPNRDVIMSVQFNRPADEKFYESVAVDDQEKLMFTERQSSVAPGKGLTMKLEPFDSEADEYARELATAHSIRPEVFQDYLGNFWGDIAVPQPWIITWGVWQSIITDVNRSGTITFIWEETDKTNNTLDMSVPEPAKGTKAMEANTNYSIPLFSGINLLYWEEISDENKVNVSEFRFYKGLSDDGLTILIESVYKDGSRQFFDLSNMEP